MKLSIKLDNETNKQIELFASEIGTAVDGFLGNLTNYVQRQAAMGLTDEQIIKNLEDQINAEVGVFSGLKRDISNIFGSSVVQTSRGFFNANVSDKETDKDMRQWITVYSGNPSTKNCDECLKRHMDVKSLTEWEQIGTPDNPFFDVHIAYGVPCHCVLMPTEISRFSSNLVEPIQT